MSDWDALTDELLKGVAPGADAQASVVAGQKRRRMRGKSKSERREVQRQAARVRIWGEITRCPWIAEKVAQIAAELDAPVGGVVPWLIARGIRDYLRGVRPAMEPSDSPRREWMISVSENDAGF